jgi:hypothetical protein
VELLRGADYLTGVMTAINRGFRSFANFLAWGVSIALYLVCFTKFFSATLPRYHRMRYFLLGGTQHLPCILHQLHEVVHGIAALPRFIRIHDRPEALCDAAH